MNESSNQSPSYFSSSPHLVDWKRNERILFFPLCRISIYLLIGMLVLFNRKSNWYKKNHFSHFDSDHHLRFRKDRFAGLLRIEIDHTILSMIQENLSEILWNYNFNQKIIVQRVRKASIASICLLSHRSVFPIRTFKEWNNRGRSLDHQGYCSSSRSRAYSWAGKCMERKAYSLSTSAHSTSKSALELQLCSQP